LTDGELVSVQLRCSYVASTHVYALPCGFVWYLAL